MFAPSRLALVAGVAIFCLSASVDARRDRQRISYNAQRDGKVLSLFNVITFENDPCTSNSKTGGGNDRNGTCYTSSECRDKGGQHSGNCAAGFGVCCIFVIDETGDEINQNCSYITNPGFPSTLTGSTTTFTHRINKCTCDVCFIRLDFESFNILGPADTLENTNIACRDTFDVTTSSGQTVPQICGVNNGKHMYIETGNDCGDAITLSLRVTTDASTTRKWDIKASQIECGSAMVPDQGCLEYLTSPVGRITTFNWDSTTSNHLQNQDYHICVRSNKHDCCIRYSPCQEAGAFSINTNEPDPAIAESDTDSDCSLDFIEGHNFSPDCRTDLHAGGSHQVYRLCGAALNTVKAVKGSIETFCDCTPQFRLRIVTDNMPFIAATDNLAHNRGICFDYNILNC